MKKRLLWLTGLLLVPSLSFASSYFRPIDPSHLQIASGCLIAPKIMSQTSCVTDLALITHSDKDGSIIPESWRSILPPESWVPLQIGVGGNFNGEAVVAPGMSGNLSPVLAGLILRNVNENDGSGLAGVKSFMLGHASYQLRLGGALQGLWVHEGHFQSMKAAYPGRGIGEILGNATRLDVGLGWSF